MLRGIAPTDLGTQSGGPLERACRESDVESGA
jgi:hypothetical protein